MRSVLLLAALGAAASALVLPDQQVLAELQPEKPQIFEDVESFYSDMRAGLESALETATEELKDATEQSLNSMEDFIEDLTTDPHPFYDEFDNDLLEADSDGTERPHKPHKSPLTVYQLISKSKHTKRFAKLLEDSELKDYLNKTDVDVTVFVPIDHDHDDHHAFEDDKEPPKWFIEALVKHHIVDDHYPSRRMFGVHTIPTLLEGEHLSEKPLETPQRLVVAVGFRGIYINRYNRVIYKDFQASNGIIHVVNHFNIPPPPLSTWVEASPTAFSTFELGMGKTGLGKVARAPHRGATVFAPANFAWKELGWLTNAFLFSSHGHKYLKALLAYHIVANQTLYSDEFYGPGKSEESIPKGRWHLDLPTLLHGKTVSVDVGRFGRLISLHVNHYSKVVLDDVIGHDGNLHVINRVLIPPHHETGAMYAGGEMSVDELKQRLDPFLNDSEHDCPETGMSWESSEL